MIQVIVIVWELAGVVEGCEPGSLATVEPALAGKVSLTCKDAFPAKAGQKKLINSYVYAHLQDWASVATRRSLIRLTVCI